MVIIFGIPLTDDYETIRLHLSQYCDTGSLKTPNHGRGKRILRPNGRYTNSDDEDEQPAESIQDTQEKVFQFHFVPDITNIAIL
jgi:hypothetical protein